MSEVVTRVAPRQVITAHKDRLVTRSQPQRVLLARGQAGPQGQSAGTAVPVAHFSYGDATPDTIYTVTQADTLTQVSIVIDTPFNGTGASLRVSVGATTVMDTTQNDPKTVAEYQSAPALDVAIGAQIVLTITPGAGASAGAGRIFLDFN